LVGHMPTFELVIPCYNEAQRLPGDALAALVRAGLHVILVDDGSTDNTPAILAQLAAAHGGAVQVLSLAQNRGKGEAIRQALARPSNASWRGYADADFAVPASEIVRLSDVAANSAAAGAVIGARVGLAGRTIERRASRHYAGRLFATAASLTLDARIYDTQCGCKWFRNNGALQVAVSELFSSAWLFDVELLGRLRGLYAANPHLVANQIVEEPLLSWRDVAGSKLRPRDFVASPLHLLRIRAALQAWRHRTIAP